MAAGWIPLGPCLRENGIAALGHGVEDRVLAGDALGGGAEEGEAGDEFESVGSAAHQIFERNAAGELVADGAGNFFVAGAQQRVAQVLADFREVADRIRARGGGTAEAFELREDVPDPMADLASSADFR